MTSAITGAGALTTAVYTVYATATTSCERLARRAGDASFMAMQ
jgi:hypothetical protein